MLLRTVTPPGAESGSHRYGDLLGSERERAVALRPSPVECHPPASKEMIHPQVSRQMFGCAGDVAFPGQ